MKEAIFKVTSALQDREINYWKTISVTEDEIVVGVETVSSASIFRMSLGESAEKQPLSPN